MSTATLDPEGLARLTDDRRVRALERSLSESNARWNDLPETARRTALALFAGEQRETIDGLWRLLYKRRPPTIEEFLTPDYLSVTVYPQWRADLIRIFSPGSVITQWVKGGSIGAGKTTAARIGQHFNEFHLNSLRDPQSYMGSGGGVRIGVKFVATDLNKSGKVAFEPYANMLRRSPHYVEVAKRRDFGDFLRPEYEHLTPFCVEKLKNQAEEIVFPNDVFVGYGSRTHHGIGEDLIGCVLDEAEFRQGEAAEKVLRMYLQLYGRVFSRFADSKHVLACMASSAATEEGVVAKHIDNVRDDPATLISEYAIWDIKFPEKMKKGHFYVMRGTRAHPTRLLLDEKATIDAGTFDPPAGVKVIKVPIDYLPQFKGNVEAALQDAAGVRTILDERPFEHLDTIEDARLTPELSLAVPLRCGTPIVRMLPPEMFSRTPQGRALKRYPGAPRYAHFDLATSGEAGICVLHKEMGPGGEIVHVVDLLLRITTHDQIAYDRVVEFAVDLRRKLNVDLHALTADQYNSVSLLQTASAERAAREVRRLSVDVNADAYYQLGNMIAQGTFRAGPCPYLRAQLGVIGIRGNKPRTDGQRKDVADAACGASYNALKNASDIPTARYVDDALEAAASFDGIMATGEFDEL